MGGPAGCYSSRTCISLRLHGEGWTGRVGSGGKAGRQLSEVYSEAGSLGTWPRLSNIGSVSVQTQLRPLVCEATVVLLVAHMNTVDVEAERVSKGPSHQTPKKTCFSPQRKSSLPASSDHS